MRRSVFSLVALLAIVELLCVVHVLASADVALETDSVTRNYADELPRIPPTEPEASLAKFRIEDGFRIELVASEPLVADPVSMAFDEHGRLFVVCMNGYSEHGDDNRGVVRLLIDSDDDGVFDRGTNYATKLSWPTAIACFDGGVFVGAAPELMYCKDVDGDGQSDKRNVLLTGFGRQNVQGMVNSFRWGLNNLLYGAAGTNGGKLKLAGDNNVAGLVSLRGRDFTWNPTQRSVQAVSGGAQHGATFDRWGERFVCSNSDHLQWVEFEDQHLQRNPLLVGYRSRNSIAEDGPDAEVYRASDVEPWRIVRTRLRIKGMVRGPVEGGGRAAGYFTSASGVTAYLGDAFGPKFQNEDYIFVGDVGSNLVHLKRVETTNLNKMGVRVIPPEREFLTSSDNWFRPVQFANGPDGALYVLDMYREVIEHPLSLPPTIKQHLDLNSGRSRGRIYRISPVGWARPKRMHPAEANDSQLVSMLGHLNGWHRETASRLILQRARASSDKVEQFAALLRAACKTATQPHARIRALYCLNSLGRLDESTLVTQLSDTHPQVRRHALKVAESAAHLGEATTSQLISMVDDTDMGVRYQLALTLGRFDWQVRSEALVSLANRDQNDRKMRFAVLSSMGTERVAMLRALLESPPFDSKSLGSSDAVLERTTNDATANSNQPLLHEIVSQIGRNRSNFHETLSLIRPVREPLQLNLAASLMLGTRLKGPALVKFLSANDEKVNEAQAQTQSQKLDKPEDVSSTGSMQILRSLLADAKRSVLDAKQGQDRRLRSLRVLCLGELEDIEDVLAELLSVQQPSTIRDAVVAELGEFDAASAAELLIGSTNSLSPLGRRKAVDLLTSKADWALQLLQAIRDQTFDTQQLNAQQRQRLVGHRDKRVSNNAKAVLARVADRATLVQRMSAKILSSQGDVQRGKQLFRKACAACHRLEGHGAEVGPNLASLRNRGSEFMLVNILDPNREVDPRYEGYNIVTQDGRIRSGIVSADTAEFTSLLQADGTIANIEKSEIEVMQATGRSLMPEGLEADLTEQGLADVIAYLVHGNQSRQSQPKVEAGIPSQ